MTEDEWYETYKPKNNHIDPDGASWNGTMFETYGAEAEFVNSQPEENVWTWVEAEGGTYLVNGYHFVNRLGYFVCSVPWEGTDWFEITIDEPEEYCYDCGERMEEDCECKMGAVRV